MADLDTAAADLVVHLKGLESQISRAQHELAELDHALGEATSHLDGDWSAVDEHVQALVAKAHEEKGQLAQQAEAAEHALGDLSTAVHGAQGEQHEAMQQGSAATQGLAEHVGQFAPHLDPLSQQVADTARSLAERAHEAEAALQHAFTQARELLQDQLAGELHHMQQEVEQAAEHMRGLVTEQQEHVDEAFADWSQKLGEVETLVEHALQDAQQHASDVAEFSSEECEKAAHEEADQLQAALNVLESLLEGLHQEATEGAADVGEEGRHALEEGLGTIHAEAGRALDALAHMRDLLTRFAFVTM